MLNFARELLEASLLDKFDAALGSFNLVNGTSVASALVSAIMVDLRQSRNEDGIEIIDAMDEEAIFDLGFSLASAIGHEDQQFTLPLGTRVKSDKPGSIHIGGEIWVTEAGKPGLFPLETVRRGAHGPNLELLRASISQAVRGKPWQRIGLPSPVLIADCEARHLLKFPPFQEAGGVVLQRWADETGASRFGAATPEQIKVFATSMAADMKTLWKRRKAVAAQAAVARGIAEAKIPSDADGVAIHAIAIDFERHRKDEHLSFYVEFDGIDEAHRPGIVLDYIPAVIEGQWRRDPVPYGIDGRSAERDALRALGADGEIDLLAEAVVRYAPEGPAAVLARLAADLETDVAFTTEAGPVYAVLFWRDGCIKAEITAPDRIVQYGDILEWYEGAFDDSAARALVGSALTPLVPLPFDVACLITDATPLYRGGVKLGLKGGRSPVNCATGHIWGR